MKFVKQTIFCPHAKISIVWANGNIRLHNYNFISHNCDIFVIEIFFLTFMQIYVTNLNSSEICKGAFCHHTKLSCLNDWKLSVKFHAYLCDHFFTFMRNSQTCRLPLKISCEFASTWTQVESVRETYNLCERLETGMKFAKPKNIVPSHETMCKLLFND